MADTAHTPTAQDSPSSRQIRVFLSSTFRDFMEERDLLVKQVFPSLRRRAQERGVEVVDVDLRWGVTQEESEQGKVIGICLAEIERCRPYFIGMLGERYGWTPGKTDYPDELFEREQLGWIRDHQGNASVTELEILHGVLNDKEMAGRAFFYFRDPAWSQGQSEPGFVCETAEEEAKLAALKDRIRASGFPVAEDLPDPKAIADQIEADLWALIEEQYPDLDQADALEKEARKHASYRQSRLGVYLGQDYVEQLEALIHGGEQKVLITGESGSGKSALIANWMHQHERENPGDVVYAHHLGCSNDANAIRPLLGRMLDTASKLLKETELITEPIQVPEDWWELTAKVAETLQDLGRWCRKAGKRWIWVLDGLDRLADDDQQALPWLPLLIPEGVSVVISALECPARAILLERQFQLLEIGPLQRKEQEQLIETYLQRYTKKLDADRVEQILASEMARSPLFLRVLLEELRQCGRFETMEAQIADYISPKTDDSVAVNDLYARVLARLESDYGYEPVRKALTTLWASHVGLNESELLAITGLAPLQWAPIDLALAQAFGRNGNLITFDHDHLRKAVENFYLPTKEQKSQTHGLIADWFKSKQEWDERFAEEFPWQLEQSGQPEELRNWLINPKFLAHLERHRGSREAVNYWRAARRDEEDWLDNSVATAIDEIIERGKNTSANDIYLLVKSVTKTLIEAGHTGASAIRLRKIALDLSTGLDPEMSREDRVLLAEALQESGDVTEAAQEREAALAELRKANKKNEYQELSETADLASLYRYLGEHEKAETLGVEALTGRERHLGGLHPETLESMNSIALLYHAQGKYSQARDILAECLKRQIFLLGKEHRQTITTMANLASALSDMGEQEEAEQLLIGSVKTMLKTLGREHPDSVTAASMLATFYFQQGAYELAEPIMVQILTMREKLLGPDHPSTITSLNNLAMAYEIKGEIDQAIELLRQGRSRSERKLGEKHPSTLFVSGNLGRLLVATGKNEEASRLLKDCFDGISRVFGEEHPATLESRMSLAQLFMAQADYQQAIAEFSNCAATSRQIFGDDHPTTEEAEEGIEMAYKALGAHASERSVDV